MCADWKQYKLVLKRFQIKHLCIDVESSIEDCSLKLKEPKRIIKIDGESFILIGVIAFENGVLNMFSRHYFTYCRSLEGK